MAAVSYTILLDGEPLPEHVLDALREVQVEDHADLADMLRLRIDVAVEEDGDSWTVLDQDLFPRLAAIRVDVAVGPELRETLIEAYVVETRLIVGAIPGDSTLEVVAMDPTVLLNLEEKVRAWPDMGDADIAETLFGEHGFDLDVESTSPTRQEEEETTIQRGTDMQLLRGLARRNGYEVFVEVDPTRGKVVGHFHPPRIDESPQGLLTVNMGAATNVDRFEASFDMLRPAVVSALGVGTADQSDQQADAGAVSSTELGGASVVPTDRPRRVLLAGTGLADSGELQTAAQAELDRSSWALVAEGEVATSRYGGVLRAKRTVSVRGVGRTFSGVWYVARVLHVIAGASYTQEFELRRNALGLAGNEDFTENEAIA